VPIVDLGFACVLSDGSLSTNHALRLAAVTEARLAEVAHRNLDDLERILFLMERGPLRLFRIGSSVVPLASHERVPFDWRPLVSRRLAEIGRRAVAAGFRLSMHPGQYTVLGSPDLEVVRRAVAEIDYSCTILDLMGLDGRHKVVVHGGGVYGDREATTVRLVQNLRSLPERLRNRLVLENDERLFNLQQILEIAEAAELPVVFDLHHHKLNPAPADAVELLERVRASWNCRPKVHLSSQRPNARPGAHDDMLLESDLRELEALLKWDADLMVEAKAKEVAALQAWGWLKGVPAPTFGA
jgi:UV DNA damage endonuclease